ncbi:hypothetical protein HYY75_01870, partial [bacterium]|nr:hypothetical protein [bacterium]
MNNKENQVSSPQANGGSEVPPFSEKPSNGFSRRNQSSIFAIIFVVFFFFPLCAFLKGYSIYLEDVFSDSIKGMVQFYNRELLSMRQKVSNERVLQQIIRGFQFDVKQQFQNKAKIKRLLQNIKTELPPNSKVILWDTDGKIMDLDDSLEESRGES